LFGFEIKRYLRGFLLLAVATAVFSLVNIAISTIPDSVIIGGDIDLGQFCGNITTGTATPTPTPTPTPSISNISFYDPFNALNTTYWINLTHPWTVINGYVRTNVSDASYNNAIYYIVDFVDSDHDTVIITTRIRIDRVPPTDVYYRYCVFLSTVDLSGRILGCFETTVYGRQYVYYDVYASIWMYTSGSATRLARVTVDSALYDSSIIRGIRDLSLKVVKINETHSQITLAGTRKDGTPFSISPRDVALSWSEFGYFGLHMSETDIGFDYVDVWITSVNATDTVYYNQDFPPPLPTTTVTVTVTEIVELGRDILVLPLGSFVRVLSFGIYVVYIIRVIKHFTPEF
jgi:hypothetical protein